MGSLFALPAVVDEKSGLECFKISGHLSDCNIKICFIKVNEVAKIAEELTQTVLDTSWMMSLDKGTKRSYSRTVEQTTKELLKIFNEAQLNDSINEQFGELMVSIGSAKGLDLLFEHTVLPLAELWKPQCKQNEGFDFHTVCLDKLINFGEAKFSNVGTKYTKAIDQANDFLSEEKHFRDRVHLINLTDQDSISQLDDDKYGVIAAFSIIAKNPIRILENALKSVLEKIDTNMVSNIYLVGVEH